MAMKPFSHGLVVGKFYPPHRGHHRVIRQASDKAETVTVVVMASAQESISLDDRVEWIRRDHPDRDAVRVVGVRCDVPIGDESPQAWISWVACVRAGLAQSRDVNDRDVLVDAVFSGEAYGPELAARLGAVHMKIERDALAAHDVRESPLRQWNGLTDATKAGLAVRVVVVGAESTGTTTLAKRLWETYRDRGGLWQRTGWVADHRSEFRNAKWRELCEAAAIIGQRAPAVGEIPWAAKDFERIALEQTRREALAAHGGSPIVICDTDAFATWVWKRRSLGMAVAEERPSWAMAPALPRRDIYLITDHHLDGGIVASRSGTDERMAMTNLLITELTDAGHSWVLVTGSLEERMDLAIRTIDPLIAARLRMAQVATQPTLARV